MQNRNRIPKHILSQKSGGTVHIYYEETRKEEELRLLSDINQLDKKNLFQSAVIVRTNIEAIQYIRLFKSHHILVKEQLQKKSPLYFEHFIKNAVACGYLERDERYDVCYRFVNLSNVIAAFIFRELSENLGEIKSKSGIKTNELKSTIPWKLYKPIFLTESSGSIDSLKASLTQSEGSGPGDNAEKAKLIFKEIMTYKEGRQ